MWLPPVSDTELEELATVPPTIVSSRNRERARRVRERVLLLELFQLLRFGTFDPPVKSTGLPQQPAGEGTVKTGGLSAAQTE